MIVNIAFLILIVIALIRTVSYGIYCLRRTLVGGISVFALAIGMVFSCVMIWITGIK